MSDGMCGGSKNPILGHFDRETYRETRARNEQRAQEEILLRASVRYDEQFSQFQRESAPMPHQQPATIADYRTLPRRIQSTNAPPGPRMLGGYGHQRPSPSGFAPRAVPTQPMEAGQSTHENWARQYQDQQLISNTLNFLARPATREVFNHPSVSTRTGRPYDNALYRAQTRGSMASGPSFAPISMDQNGASIATGRVNPRVEFDNAFRGWMDTMGAEDDEDLWADDLPQTEVSESATAPISEAPVTSPAAEATNSQEEQAARTEHTRNSEDSKLAIAAQEIINSVSEDQSDKFQQSEFLSLMRRIASKDLVVRDNALVDASTLATNSHDASITNAGSGNYKQATAEDEE
ncbi:uncharacterized protein GGS22DRAFT_154441 [Annulohypoxylon maeteangense]|uniref:uncharacterized protein n=1 Tax=Annulohypoxylon maeteangense TaxID=1927788 RepID=UPI002007AB25|nr:uncharacterized protein GGS22DRAFT_154441 [Annulohypoxylon maeteangense]KAI0887840.1 hypothetical protein GGS22DRAFT_154441 [Annulohypoxylon maeteangense]